MGNLVNLPGIDPSTLFDDTNNNQPRPQNQTKFDAKNYLNVRLDEENGEVKKEIRIRLLPITPDSGKVIQKVHMHNIKVPTTISKSGFKNYFCLEDPLIDHAIYGDKCPFCEAARKANKLKWDEKDPLKQDLYKDMWKANVAKEGGICRCIERGKEDEGVKFWKFNIRTDELDPYNQIKNLYSSAYKQGINIFDYEKGYDLIVTISQGGQNTKGNTVTITTAMIASPLSTDVELASKWINDPKKMTDVFGIKPYEYLQLILEKKEPRFDKALQKWVAKEDFESTRTTAKEEAEQQIADAEADYKQNNTNVQTFEEASQPINTMFVNDNDLPF